MTQTYRVTEYGPESHDRWTDPECYRDIAADGVREAAVRYCERADPAWMLSRRRGDGEHIRRFIVYVRTPAGDEVWDVPIVAGVASWQYRDDDREPIRRRRA
jgi:hypothetical protein